MSVSKKVFRPKIISMYLLASFKAKLFCLRVNLDKILKVINVEETSDLVYEHCIEIKRQVQLETEQRIANIKESNFYDINKEVDELPKNLQQQIFLLQNQNEIIITKIDEYQDDQSQAPPLLTGLE